MTRENILSKLNHLFKLAEHPNTNPNEASVAADRAQQIMWEHKISRAEISIEDEEPEEPLIVKDALAGQNARILTWKLELLGAIAYSNFCKVVYWSARSKNPYQGVWRNIPAKMNVYGRKSDVESTLYLYKYLVREIDRLAYEDIQKNKRESARRWGASFRLGATSIIGKRLRQQREEQETGLQTKQNGEACTALIKREDAAVSDFVNQMVGKTHSLKRDTTIDLNGYAEGQKEGQKVNLGKNDKGLNAPALQLK